MKKGFFVGDPFRENELSLKPGGYVVTIKYSNGKVYSYNRVKDPKSFIEKALQNQKDGLNRKFIVDYWV